MADNLGTCFAVAAIEVWWVRPRWHKSSNESQGICCYIIIIVGKQAVYITQKAKQHKENIANKEKAN